MKKTLVSALTTALVVGAASTTFAAANPFADVPADHWAYDAVSQLAADGVIEGYGDNNFKGDKNITRYEMAQMVAKAMAKTNVSGNDKAIIDKLAAEFSDELNNLGVRVANLEKNADKVKWNGEARYTYTSTRHEDAKRANKDELRLRLEPSAEVNANWHVKARLDANNDMAKDTTDNVKLARIWAQGDYDNFQVQLGKYPHATAYDSYLMFNDQMSGAKVTFGNKLKVSVEAGRLNLKDDARYGAKDKNGYTVYKAGADDAADLQGITFNYGLGKANGTAAYYHVQADAFKNNTTAYGAQNFAYSKDGKEDNADIWEVAGTYKFDKNVSLLGAYAENTKADAYEKAGVAQLNYKGAQKANKGSWGAYVAYRHQGGNVAIGCVNDGVGFNQKGWEFGTQYTLMKNVQAKAIYFDGKDLANDKDASKLFGRVEFFF